MTSNSSSSLASDLSRIVILGIAFDLSRYVAKGIWGALSTTNFNDNTNKKCQEDKYTQDGIEKRSDLPGTCASKGEDTIKSGNEQRNDGDIMSPLTTVASVEITERWKLHLSRLKRRISNNAHDKRCIGLCCYLLLPPPLLLYGAWGYLLRRNNKVQHNSSLFGIYFSSILTSFGLLCWVFPGALSWDNDDETNAEDVIYNDKPQKLQENLHESSLTTEQNSAESLTKSLPISSATARPPLAPNSIEQERRPRSDSLRSVMSECSVNTQTINAPVASQKKYLEILVHNVSHTDLILGLSGEQGVKSILKRAVSVPFPAEFEDTPRKNNASPHNNATDSDEQYVLCRPRFSAFDLFSRRVLSELQGQIESASFEELNSNKPASASNKNPLYQKIISYPRYERSSKTARYTLVTPRPSDQFLLPIGFNLERAEGINNTAVDPCEMPNLRLRGRDIPKVDPSLLGETPRRMNLPPQQLETIHSPPNDEQEVDVMHTPSRGSMQERLRINAVFFPLLATLLPRWLGQIADKFGGEEGASKKVAAPLHSPNVKKVVVLVSGVGTPRNWTHSISGNSTQTCAELMELFIHVLYPDITVVRIHSETNIFRYDENITFATQELMPCIDSYRDAHARCEPYPDEKLDGKVASTSERNPFNPEWRQSVSVTYSFADGSAARSHAIQASLRPYRPTYFHFWQLKTFWHETKITDEDIEVHSFEEMETVPAMAVDQTSDTVMMVVNEMKEFRKDFIETLKDGGRSDLFAFWLRKTKKPVLAVLLVQQPGGKHILYRGTNMEVSMPTGSLCAERNVIGTALASDPGLKREDLLMVAVLSVQLPELSPPPGPPICRPVMIGADFAPEVEDKLKQHQAHGGMRRTASTSSFASIAEDGPPVSSKPTDSEEWEMDVFQPVMPLSPLASPVLTAIDKTPKSSASAEAAALSSPKAKEAVLIPELYLSRLSETSPSSNVSGQSTPKRRIALYQNNSHSKMGGGVKRRKQSLLVQSLEDMNPLKPCGACNEWLKKIAESNPHFKVLTFTDTKCNGVYVSPCQD
mmetsp:Transcript_11877/g.21951  ORF Transcript_11877/g.21951 Transcript_11877/m.21951 type:complete len:1044 (+) Transcript_11877:69-3200(+)|eukprot:CAMPEP_0201882598 /NCGR_PEP_ID=MMETSP0902-20130614/14298_1 /ASSEMBLY_ACC=CAM_ASM_000551 /TAXON_ID=420261 /ORGANISM="Thalassiosira antarctica, Strain CCMP982" /LENGTH=1043 /DNA_ID=CAMNT_0048411171 /DNA_START=25 /DNA_END=3156 /DNA_ORIENTATION=-